MTNDLYLVGFTLMFIVTSLIFQMRRTIRMKILSMIPKKAVVVAPVEHNCQTIREVTDVYARLVLDSPYEIKRYKSQRYDLTKLSIFMSGFPLATQSNPHNLHGDGISYYFSSIVEKTNNDHVGFISRFPQARVDVSNVDNPVVTFVIQDELNPTICLVHKNDSSTVGVLFVLRFRPAYSRWNKFLDVLVGDYPNNSRRCL
jgi:hypothetical protein